MEQFVYNVAAAELFGTLDLQINKELLERGKSSKNQIEVLIQLKATAPIDDLTISCISLECETDDGSNMRREENRETVSDTLINWQGKEFRISKPLNKPTRTISTLYNLVDVSMINQSKKYIQVSSKLNVNKVIVHPSGKMIKGVLLEVYKGLGILKTHRNLNLMELIKILKKFDKVTGKATLPVYLKVAERSYFNNTSKATKPMDEVEEIFVKNLARGDRGKVMIYLMLHRQSDSHMITFFMGLSTGLLIALLTSYCIMAHHAGMYSRQSGSFYMGTVYPVLSTFSLFFLHLFLYGCNIFMWRKAQIDYNSIFEFTPAKELEYRDVFLVCTTSMCIVVGVMLVHLILIVKGYSTSQVQAIPAILLLAFFITLICPFHVVYKSSRYHLLRVIRNIIFSPLYKVVMVDFFMADQLCSQVPMLRSLEYVACYYISGTYKARDYQWCISSSYNRTLTYAVSFLPYYWRAMQCTRRWFDEGEICHLVNLGKYISAMLATGVTMMYQRESSFRWFSLVIALLSITTLYQLYWDFVKDWGLLQPNSKNPWLRNELIFHSKFIYFLSMGLNIVLRLAWLQTILPYKFGALDCSVAPFIIAALEAIRRGQWNFYRLENEHLISGGKFRAVVNPVPFPIYQVNVH